MSGCKIVRYKDNPFIGDLFLATRNKTVQISKLGKDNNVLVNQDTGEFLGGTAVIAHKQVDKGQFVKLFTQHLRLAFDLTQAGQKCLVVLFWVMSDPININKDSVILDKYTLDKFLQENKELSLSLITFRRGLSELSNAKIIAPSERRGSYFINPSFAFNGDRVVFATILDRQK